MTVKKLPLILVSTALLAACGTAGNSSSSTGAAIRLSSGATIVHQGANAGSDTQGDLDVNHVNPATGKVNGIRPLPPTQPRVVVAPTPAFGLAKDRCSGGIGNPPAGNGANGSIFGGIRHPLPGCMSQ